MADLICKKCGAPANVTVYVREVELRDGPYPMWHYHIDGWNYAVEVYADRAIDGREDWYPVRGSEIKIKCSKCEAEVKVKVGNKVSKLWLTEGDSDTYWSNLDEILLALREENPQKLEAIRKVFNIEWDYDCEEDDEECEEE